MATPSQVKRLSLVAIQLTRTRRRALSVIFTLLAWGLLTLSAFYFRPANGQYKLRDAALLMLAGGLVLAIAVALNRASLRETRESHPIKTAESPDITASPSRVAVLRRVLPQVIFGLGVLLLLALVEINGHFLGIPALHPTPLRTQFLLLCGGVVLVVAGLGTINHGQFVGTQHAASLRWVWYEIIIVLVITLLALVLRLWRLEDVVHKFVDEIHFSTAVADLLDNPTQDTRLLSPFAGITAFPWLYPYLQAETAALHGRSLESLRLVSAILGTLTIPAVYLLARTLFDRTTAIIVALLLATFPPHIHFSRIGLNNVADPLFGTLALAFLLRGLKSGRTMDFAVAGGALGLTQYFYEGGRLLFPPLIATWLMVMWFIRPHPKSLSMSGEGLHKTPPLHPMARGDSKGDERPLREEGGEVRHNLAVLALAALLVGLPVYSTLLAERKPFAARMDTVALGGAYYQRVVEEGTPQTPQEQITRPFLVYVHLPETGLFYGGDQPLILESLVPLFFLGIFGLLWRARQPGIIILMWVVLTSIGNMLMTESAIFARYVVAFPALAILLALGLRYTLPLLWPRWRAWPMIMVALAAVIGFAQVRYYFVQHLNRYNYQIRPAFDSEDPIFRSVDFPAGTQVHIISNSTFGQQYLSGIAGYLNNRIMVDVRTPGEISPEYLSTLTRGVDHAFFVEPTDYRTLVQLREQFNLGAPTFSPFNVPKERQLVMFYVEGQPAEG